MEKDEYALMYELETDYWWYKALHELVEFHVKKITAADQLRIFDAGCGTGKMVEILNSYGGVEGIDYSEEAVSYCKKRGLKTVKVEDLNNWNPNGELYDVIISLDVLYHAAVEDDMGVLEKFHTALKKNGTLILNLPAFNILRRRHDIQVSGKRRYRKDSIIGPLKDIGFIIQRASYRLPHLFFIILVKKALGKFAGPPRAKSDLSVLPSWLNKLFLFINRIENKVINSGVNIPFGSSLFIIARKK